MQDFDRLAEMLNAYQQQIDRAIGPNLLAFQKVLARFGEETTQAMESATRTLTHALEAMARAESWDADRRRFAAAMLALGWPPVMDIYVSQVREIAVRFESEDSEALADEVSAFLLEFYDQATLERKLDDWRRLRWVEERLPILERVVQAHCDGQYELSVPAMLPQIEGVVASGFGHVGRLSGKALASLFDRLLAQGDGTTDNAYLEYLNTVVLVSFEHGTPIGSSLSRHAILHGADTSYATAANSLRTILLFDYLVAAFRLVGLKGRDIVHMPGCPQIMRSKSEREVFGTLSAASEVGLRPCRVCRPDMHRHL